MRGGGTEVGKGTLKVPYKSLKVLNVVVCQTKSFASNVVSHVLLRTTKFLRELVTAQENSPEMKSWMKKCQEGSEACKTWCMKRGFLSQKGPGKKYNFKALLMCKQANCLCWTWPNPLNISNISLRFCRGESIFKVILQFLKFYGKPLRRNWSREKILSGFYDRPHKLFYIQRKWQSPFPTVYSNDTQEMVTSVKSILNQDSFFILKLVSKDTFLIK